MNCFMHVVTSFFKRRPQDLPAHPMAQLVQYIKYLFDVTDRQIDFRMFCQEQYDDFGLNLHNPDHPIYNELGWTSNHADMVEEYFMKEEENKK